MGKIKEAKEITKTFHSKTFEVPETDLEVVEIFETEVAAVPTWIFSVIDKDLLRGVATENYYEVTYDESEDSFLIKLFTRLETTRLETKTIKK